MILFQFDYEDYDLCLNHLVDGFQACVKKTGKDRKFMTVYCTFVKSRLKWEKITASGKFFTKYQYISIHKW